ncbi:MAG: hypothetical protein ACRDPY_42525 [Streptosporangiaceae bacterium]
MCGGELRLSRDRTARENLGWARGTKVSAAAAWSPCLVDILDGG